MTTCSVIIPAYNEEDFISKTLTNVKLAFEYCEIEGEIIVVDNNSDDSTASLAKSRGAIVLHEPIQQIARARNTGAKQASSNLLVFLDADTTLSGELLKCTLDAMAENRYVGGGVLLKLADMEESQQKFVGMWNRFSLKMKLAAGCYIFCLKSSFELVGGFNEKIYASEEIWFVKRLKKASKKQGLDFKIIEEQRIETSARKLDWFSPQMLIFQIMLFAFFPFLCRFKVFCFLWYKRPAQK
jgi:glycosyltransferase involved in cell wall biosynthesis